MVTEATVGVVPGALTETTPSGLPRVSIGLAVFNGEPYLDAAISSILAQTYGDFELIISDNASTDRTEEICRGYARARPASEVLAQFEEHRRREQRKPHVLPRPRRVLPPRRPRRRLRPDPARAVRGRPRRASRGRAVPHRDGVDRPEGKEQGVRYGIEGTASTPNERFRQLSYRYYPCEATYGLLRSDVLRRTRLQQNYTGSDRVLLCELALHGPFYLIREPLFFKRFHNRNIYKDCAVGWRGSTLTLPVLVGRHFRTGSSYSITSLRSDV